jgi:FKBP-type peptidyl-prolyl cis-trans isomerase
MKLTILAAVLALGATAGYQKAEKSAEKSGEKSGEKAAGDKAGSADTGKPGDPAQKRPSAQQVTPPLPVASPPADAVKTASGLSFKSLAEGTGPSPGQNDRVTVHYTGWRPSGETFYTTRNKGQPVPTDLWNVAPGFSEALTLMKQGGKAMFWIPPELAYRGKAMGQPETLVFEVELVGIEAAPPVPTDLTAPPADAKKTAKGVAYKVLQAGTGKEKPRSFDVVTVKYSAWDAKGRMFESTEVRKQPRQTPLNRESPGIEEAVTQMVVGEKARFWVPNELLKKGPTTPEGTAVYDIELVAVDKQPEPPAVPKDVAAAPADAKKTEKGTFYKVLKKGTGKEKPTATSTVKVHYTGWTTDGRMFDSSVTRGQPAEFPLNGVIAGWTDGLQVMVVGEKTRFWIPEELAYKGQPGRPAGMLVFDVELLEIKAAGAPPGHP